MARRADQSRAKSSDNARVSITALSFQPSSQNVPACVQGFPPEWNKSNPGDIILREHWNTSPDKVRGRFDVDWDDWENVGELFPACQGVPAMASITLRMYYGIHACIIPVGFFPLFDDVVPRWAFTVGGPCDKQGGKEFYYMEGSPANDTRLVRYNRRFSSIDDYFQNSSTAGFRRLSAIEGGDEAAEEIITRFNLW
ncbi:hypothetical protein B0H16DRAFT_1702715 [Mycena metata]|uniref:Uncharacterized protein n=1 Tax=Mycena metata TaxID=1033252 RepID=A0AAD7H5T1_9AGAR|nr:hypothetical protein B0H16DRAFT_1702715 [Mycena metata]